VLDIALVLGCSRSINCDALYGLLTECLQDGSPTMFVLPSLVVCYLACDIILFLRQTVKLTKAEDSGASLCRRIAELEAENS
jgi:hypothetical protein